jgi:eukaryotic-like serine/threonine-protein kinase
VTTPDVQDRLQRALGTAYTVERELGGGGMSRVFVADEAALGRKVVVKVLRPELAEELSAERFKREVRMAAQLQHPHVVPVLAAGEMDGGVLYYTMPFVEGESLRARLQTTGAMPIADVVRILRDAASALAYAHGRGIVHRDIKPENVLLSHGGAVVADFGIAKAISAAVDGPMDSAHHPSTLTAVGTSLGTPAYMAPEQASGDLVDHRADLYALGVVGYEMLAGRAPFEGRNAQQLLSAQVTQLPEPVERRRATAPPALAALVMRLLEKHPADRPQSADEVVAALDGIAGGAHTTPDAIATRARPDRLRRALPWVAVAVIAALTGLGGAALGWDLGARRRAAVVATNPVIATILAPPGYELRPDASHALSPDGTRLAFVAADARGATSIWVRPLAELTPSRLEGTEGAAGPFWSPDGGSLGFFAAGELRVIDLRNGSRRTLCPALRAAGGTWTSGGVIVYSPDFLNSPLFKVSASGGACTQLTRFARGEFFDHRRPSALPDGRHVLFSSYRANAAYVVDVDSGAIREVRVPGNEAQFAAPHWMLYRDRAGPYGQSGPIFAQPLDMRTFKPQGEPRVVLDRTLDAGSYYRFSATERALVAVRPSGRPWALLWVDRQSTVTDSVVAPADAGPMVTSANFGVSHDGRSIAFGGMGLWVHSRDRNASKRLRAETVPRQGLLDPSWSPGDSMLAYSTVFQGPIMLRVYNLNTDRSDSLASFGRRAIRGPDWSPDGGRLVFQVSSGESANHEEIWMYTFATRHLERAVDVAANTTSPRWSPDGKSLAYVSDESGAPEVYVRRVAGGASSLISTAGGDVPRWRADGRELFYRAPDGAIMGVTVAPSDAAAPSKPRVVVASPPFNAASHSLAVTPDAQRFIAYARGEPYVFTLMLDWTEKMK